MNNRDNYRQLYQAIREILFSEWDPIGVNDVAPDDEYDSYVPTIYLLLEQCKGEQQIVDQLRRFALENMGLSHVDEERDRKVARLLVGLVEPEQRAGP